MLRDRRMLWVSMGLGLGTMGRYGRAVGLHHPQMSPFSPPPRHHCPQRPLTLHALESRISQHVAEHLGTVARYRNRILVEGLGCGPDTVTEWWQRASAPDLHHVPRLPIPRSLWDHIAPALRVDLRERVA